MPHVLGHDMTERRATSMSAGMQRRAASSQQQGLRGKLVDNTAPAPAPEIPAAARPGSGVVHQQRAAPTRLGHIDRLRSDLGRRTAPLHVERCNRQEHARDIVDRAHPAAAAQSEGDQGLEKHGVSMSPCAASQTASPGACAWRPRSCRALERLRPMKRQQQCRPPRPARRRLPPHQSCCPCHLGYVTHLRSCSAALLFCLSEAMKLHMGVSHRL